MNSNVECMKDEYSCKIYILGVCELISSHKNL